MCYSLMENTCKKFLYNFLFPLRAFVGFFFAVFWFIFRTNSLISFQWYHLEHIFSFALKLSLGEILSILCYVYVHMPGIYHIYLKLIFSDQRTCLSNLPRIGTQPSVLFLVWNAPYILFSLLNLNHPQGPSSNLHSFRISPMAISFGNSLSPSFFHPFLPSFPPSFYEYILSTHSL